MSGETRRRFAVAAADRDWFANHPDRLHRIRPALPDELRAVSWPMGSSAPTEGHGYAVLRFDEKLLFARAAAFETEPDEEESEQMFNACEAAIEEGVW